MRKGEVWWANLPSPIGKRPVVLLSRDEAYSVRNAVTVAEITSTIRNIPVEVNLGTGDGLPKKCLPYSTKSVKVEKSLRENSTKIKFLRDYGLKSLLG